MGKTLVRMLLFPWYLLRWAWRRKWLVLSVSLFSAVVMAVTLGCMYYYYVIQHPGPEFTRGAIMSSLSMETPVYYDDGKSVIGVFFENEHRIYIKYEDIPKDFVNALIAAEDKKFFQHHGIDPVSILRAAYMNFQAGKIIQGGSTLTQQTAKNLFKRSGRTFATKWREFVQTLKLEAHYSKEDIIEFFTNQFFVSGTGRGLAIASKYFFDKPVSQLSLLECAFIAGSVRAPNRYNPLVQPTPEKTKETLVRANERKRYVLQNMVSMGMISSTTYHELVNSPIPFKEGKVFHPLNVIMDYVREELQSERFQEILENHGVSNISTSGIRIYTTVNRDLQEASLRTVRKHLSYLETMLSGYERNAVQSRYAKENVSEATIPQVGRFVFGHVTENVREGDKSRLVVRVGDVLGEVDYQGLVSLSEAIEKNKKGMWATPSPSGARELLSQIQVGDLVYVYVKGRSSENGELLLDLEQRPALEGGLIISRQGKILAMVGGFENVYFNRAVEAKRQLGSIFKPLVFTAALQLGWNLTDPLENDRDVFVFQNQFYFPRPDHESPYNRVSLAWAGVKSENLASVWLLYHLCDKLSFSQFKTIAGDVDLTPRENESYHDFQTRIRDSRGILVSMENLREAAYQGAKEELITDLIFEGKTKDAEAVRELHYGAGFDEYRESLSADSYAMERGMDELSSAKEYGLMQTILKRHFLRYHHLNEAMMSEWNALEQSFLNVRDDNYQFFELPGKFFVGSVDGKEVLAYGEDLSGKGFVPLDFQKAREVFSRINHTPLASSLSVGDVLIGGDIPSPVLSSLYEATERELVELNKQPPYSMVSLWKNRDYRVMVGLQYVVKLCKTMGIETPLESVLSFPLGPNAVSLLDMVQAYTTLTEGKHYPPEGSFVHNESVIIDRITDAEGAEIYRYRPQERQILDPHVVAMVDEILKNVVQYGTGTKAQNAVKLTVDLEVRGRELTICVPTLGKTGTANEYSNSSYIGFIPSLLSGNDVSVRNSFVMATYVGYDDNSPMKNRHVRIFGASGALPIWIDVADQVVKNSIFQGDIDPIDLAFLPENALQLPQPSIDATAVPIDEGSGLLLTLDTYLEGVEPVAILYAYGQREGKIFKPQRFFAPVFSNPAASVH